VAFAEGKKAFYLYRAMRAASDNRMRTKQAAQLCQLKSCQLLQSCTEKSHLARFTRGKWPWRLLKFIPIASFWQTIIISLPVSSR